MPKGEGVQPIRTARSHGVATRKKISEQNMQ